MAVTLKPHQKKAVEELDNGRILVGDVGTGKSLTAVAYYIKAELPKDVYVITSAKKRNSGDWEKEFAHFGVSTEPIDLSDSSGARRGILRVDSWNNIGKYEDVEDAFFIFDEQRLVGTGAWTKSFYKIAKRNRWILLSATPGDTWLDYAPVFIANGWYKNITQFKEDHVVYAPYSKFPKILRYSATGKLVRHRNNILVQMPYLRHTTRKIKWLDVEYRQDLVEEATKRRWNPLEERPLKDIAELFRVVRKIVNGDPTRLEAVRGLMALHPRLIVFYSFDYELELLRTLISGESRYNSRILISELGPSELTSESDSDLMPKVIQLDTTSTQPHRNQATESSDERISLTHHGEMSKSQPSFPDDKTSRLNEKIISGDRSTEEERWESDESKSTDTGSSSSRMASSSKSVGLPNGPSSRDCLSNEPIFLDTVIAEWNGHKHEPLPTTERWVYLVQYDAGSEAWNCTTTDAMVFWSLPYSYRRWHQSFGRIDRLNTPYSTLYYYVLFSRSWIDLAIRKSLMAKKDFNESSFGAKI